MDPLYSPVKTTTTITKSFPTSLKHKNKIEKKSFQGK